MLTGGFGGRFSSRAGNGYRKEKTRGLGNYGVADLTVEVILVTGLSLKIEVALKEDFQTIEVMDIREMALVVAKAVLVGWLM